MKNLTKQELTSFIGILLKKNPLIVIDVCDDSFIFKYFNGEISTIKIHNVSILLIIIGSNYSQYVIIIGILCIYY